MAHVKIYVMVQNLLWNISKRLSRSCGKDLKVKVCRTMLIICCLATGNDILYWPQPKLSRVQIYRERIPIFYNYIGSFLSPSNEGQNLGQDFIPTHTMILIYY